MTKSGQDPTPKGGGNRRHIKVEGLARVEGEGSLEIATYGEKLLDLKLRIFEPPRFFEALLRGRSFEEVPDITARICGICPVAYQMSSVHAIESAFGIRIPDALVALRRLLYCGEWIESHVLHMVMLHAPDFLKLPSAVELAGLHRDQVESALRVKKAGNTIVAKLGGREIHPVNVKVGGFHSLPSKADMEQLGPTLEEALTDARELLHWVSDFDFPDASQSFQSGHLPFVSLAQADEYPMSAGLVAIGSVAGGLEGTLRQQDYERYFAECQVPHSTALHARLINAPDPSVSKVSSGRGSAGRMNETPLRANPVSKRRLPDSRDGDATVLGAGAGRIYLTGPLARFHHNHLALPKNLQREALALGLDPQRLNPFRSIQVRGLEVLFALEEAIRIVDGYRETTEASVPVRVPETRSMGAAATEAPRGLLYHRYEINSEGLIEKAQIIPPTSQNQGCIEADLRDLVRANLDLPDDKLQHLCEQAIRNYDPCISCATHFLDFKRKQLGEEPR